MGPPVVALTPLSLTHAPGTQSGAVPALQLATPLLVPAAWYGLALAWYRPCTLYLKQASKPATLNRFLAQPPSR